MNNTKLKSLLKTKSIHQYSNEDDSRLINYITKLEKENKKLKEGVIKSIMYIKSRRRFKNIYSMILDESYISNYETVELLNMLKEVLKWD